VEGIFTATATRTELNVHDKLIAALGTVDRPGKVCTGGDRPLTMPGAVWHQPETGALGV